MKLAATMLVWLALLAGLLQVVICSVFVFSAGWVAPIILILLLLPFVPLILLQEVQPWRRLDPIVPAMAALVSIAISGGFYWIVYVKMD